MGEVVDLCEEYVRAVKSDEPGTQWLERSLWPKLQHLFVFIEELDQARMNMRDAQHETFKENEELKRHGGEQRQLEIKCASLEGELAAAQQAMGQGDRDIEELKRENSELRGQLEPYKEEVREVSKRLKDSQEAYAEAAAANKELGESLKRETALVIENARKYEEQLKRTDDLVYEIEALKDSKLVSGDKSKLQSKVRMLHGLVNTLRACNEGYALALDEFLDGE